MKKAIVCDMDGTLTESKSTLTRSMSETICKVLETHFMAVVSGGDYPQFEKQFLSHMVCSDERLTKLLVFPTSGAECYRYDGSKWAQVYDLVLKKEEKEKILKAFEQAILVSGVTLDQSFGERFEDRGEQITFSACGQEAPLDVKGMWDPNQLKRQRILVELQKLIPEFEITIGGMTSIDVTRKGINKAFAIEKIEELLGVSKEEIVFIGDALYPGGNDTKARDAGVECIQVSGPAETEQVLKSYAQAVVLSA
jgi:HAD superfamily hydrolase (TIGR01484 family)